MFHDKAMLLADALESGEYPQTQCTLCRLVKEEAEDGRLVGFCCLGVACEVAIKNGVELPVKDVGEFRYYGVHHNSAYMPDPVVKFFGFQDSHGSTGAGPEVLGGHASLANANDHGTAFAQIAAYIRKNYKTL